MSDDVTAEAQKRGMVVEAGQGGDAGDSSPQTTVPLSALQAERANRQRLEREMAELKGTVDTLKQTQEQPKEHTRADLQAAVDAGRISQVDADRILDEQRERSLETKVSAKIETRMEEASRAKTIAAEIEKYRTFKPDIMEDGSEARTTVAAEYERQVTELGKPPNLQTELDALAAIFGPASRLQTGRKPEPETHQETGSDGGPSVEVAGKPPKGLNADARKYYGRQIESGMYKDWAEVEKMLERGSPSVKRRLGV